MTQNESTSVAKIAETMQSKTAGRSDESHMDVQGIVELTEFKKSTGQEPDGIAYLLAEAGSRVRKRSKDEAAAKLAAEVEERARKKARKK